MMTRVEKSAVMDVPVNLAYEQWARFEDFRSSWTASSR